MSVKFNRFKKIKIINEFDKDKKILVYSVFFLNASIMLFTGMVVFNENLFVWAKLVNICHVVFWWINLPIISVYGLVLLYLVIKIMIVIGVKLLCLIPAVDRKIDKENLINFRSEKK